MGRKNRKIEYNCKIWKVTFQGEINAKIEKPVISGS